jgi:ASC-1-like (ASCH) protein
VVKKVNYHLVILKKPYLVAILDGRKTAESRFYQTKQKWLSLVNAGDKLFLKASSGPISATAVVSSVKIYENLNEDKITELKNQFNHQILGEEQYWQEKLNSRFGILCRLKDVQPIPPKFIKKADWRAWVVLTKDESFGLLDDI